MKPTEEIMNFFKMKVKKEIEKMRESTTSDFDYDHAKELA